MKSYVREVLSYLTDLTCHVETQAMTIGLIWSTLTFLTMKRKRTPTTKTLTAGTLRTQNLVTETLRTRKSLTTTNLLEEDAMYWTEEDANSQIGSELASERDPKDEDYRL